MNAIIGQLRARKRKQNTKERNKIIGGIGTIEGRIWIAYESKSVVRKAIIKKDEEDTILNPTDALRNLERGPTGNHDILISNSGVVQLLYCHQIIAKITYGGNGTLCGRVFIVYEDIEQDDDDSEEHELKIGEHLELSAGTIQVRVSAGGHKIYINKEDSTVICSKFYKNQF